MASATFEEVYSEFLAVFQANFSSGIWSTIAQNAASPLTNLYVSLHNGDPGDNGNQTTNETTYTGYTRASTTRNSSGWIVNLGSATTASSVYNSAVINWPICSGTGDTITNWGIGTAPTGAGNLLYYGPMITATQVVAPFTSTSASPAVLTTAFSASYLGLAVNAQVLLYPAVEFLSTVNLGAGLTAGIPYYVGTATGNTITLSTTLSNANPVNTTGVGSGWLALAGSVVVSLGYAPTMASEGLAIGRN